MENKITMSAEQYITDIVKAFNDGFNLAKEVINNVPLSTERILDMYNNRVKDINNEVKK